jgi:hypothetical protein
MAFDGRHNKLRRKEAVGMEDLMLQYLRDMKLTSGMNRQRAIEAWNTVSGASRYTLSVTFERGVMTNEIIMITAPTDMTSFSMQVACGSLIPTLNDDNSVDFLDNDGNMVYHVSIPYLSRCQYEILQWNI